MNLRGFITILSLCTQLYAYTPIRVGLISLPVNGTHLADKCIELLLKPFGGWKRPKPKIGEQLMAGIDQHMDFFKKNNYKMIFMIRDPRDRVVSYAFKIKNFNPKLNRSIESLMLSTITQYGKTTYQYLTPTDQYKYMGDFSEYYALYYPWFAYRDLLVIFFENLVGPRAGGSLELQLAEIKKIADFLELPVTDEHILDVAENIFGDSFSFRDPKIGRWKEYFTEEHKAAFKATPMAQFLIDFGYADDYSW